MSPSQSPVNLNSRVLKIMNLPLTKRIIELTKMFEDFPVRQLQEIFPQLVHSMFGINGNPVGWGLRTTTKNEVKEFDSLQKFFGVTGPWMRMCHSLLADHCKFELDVNLLPDKFVNMLRTRTDSMFYAAIIDVDRVGNHLGTLSLNAFDFYVIHFVLHAIKQLHHMNPIAMEIHKVHATTVYQELVSEYLSNFLPLYPDSRIEPMDISRWVKARRSLPSQTLRPQRQSRFLRIPTSLRLDGTESGGGDAIANSGRIVGSSSQRGRRRAYAWRSESVLHFFVDIWLRCDIHWDLPSSEFVIVVRSLIKQVHFFASTAPQDHTSLWAQRKGSRNMIKARIYPFICGLVNRWPLDNSVILVLDLWLCYIQPWRYTLAAVNQQASNPDCRPLIPYCFDAFIINNLRMYSHIFVLLLPRFKEIDYTVKRNADMVECLAMLFSQDELIERLQRFEGLNAENSYGGRNNWLSAGTQGSPVATTNFPKLFSEPMQRQIENFLLAISLGRNAVLRDIEALQSQITERQRAAGPLKQLYNKIVKAHKKDEKTLHDLSRIPEVLRECIAAFCNAFKVDPANLSMYESLPHDPCSPEGDASIENLSVFDSSNSLDVSNAANMQPTTDPALLPVRRNVVKFFENMLHAFAMKINDIYIRDDYLGRLARRLLYGPMTEQVLDKRTGNPILCERLVPPRVCLRRLSSIPVILIIVAFLIFGNLLLGSWTFGISLLVLIFLGCHMLLALLY
ncbi:hypothetical protein KR018_001909 [Drosophila ironensis]|nr:hypothetical protein KR018_001909 [Drosophila ironensis]